VDQEQRPLREQRSLRKQRPLDDHERAVAIGEDFGLGALVKVLRSRKFPAMTGWGALLGILTVLMGLPIVAGISAVHYALTTKVVVGAVFGALFLFSCLLVGRGVSRSRVDGRLYRYFGGLAQLVQDEPEPRVVRWTDVDTFTVSVYKLDEATARLNGFTLHTTTGTSLPGLRRYRQPELHDLVTGIGKVLTPRLVPAMTERYESGEPVVFGKVRVDQAAITVETLDADPEVIEWSGIRWVAVAHLPQVGAMRIPQCITITRKAGHGVPLEVELSGVPNGIFLPPLLEHGARRNGIPVYGYGETGPDLEALLAAPPPSTAPVSSVPPPPSTAPASPIPPPPSARPDPSAAPGAVAASVSATASTSPTRPGSPTKEASPPWEPADPPGARITSGAPTAPFRAHTTPPAAEDDH
jgi:hypothetical protein